MYVYVRFYSFHFDLMTLVLDIIKMYLQTEHEVDSSSHSKVVA